MQRNLQLRIDHHPSGDSSHPHVAGRQQRIIRQHRADAGHDHIDSAALAVDHAAAGFIADPLALAFRRSRGDLAVDGLRPLHGHPRQPGLQTMHKRIAHSHGRRTIFNQVNLDSCGAQTLDAARRGRIEIAPRDHHPCGLRIDDRLRARPGLALVIARFERAVERGAARAIGGA